MSRIITGKQKKVAKVATVVLCLLAMPVILQAQVRKWALHPTLNESVERIKVGELTSIRNTGIPVGALDEPSRQEYLKSLKANDREGIQELLAAGRIVLLSPDTGVRILERDEAELDKLMNGVHDLTDIDKKMWKDCMENSIERVRAGLSPGACGNTSYTEWYDARTLQLLFGVSPGAYVDSHVQVRVRVLTGKESGKKLWVQYGLLSAPSHPDPQAEK